MVRLTPLRSLCVSLVICLLLTFPLISKILDRQRGYDLLDPQFKSDRQPLSDDVPYGIKCSPFAAGVMDKVTIVLKMGAGEVSTRLPAYLNRLGRCGQDILLFSDRQDRYDGLEIHDALANLDPKYRHDNPDFEMYDQYNDDASQQQRVHDNDGKEKSRKGWRLDKYKFLPMMEFTRHLRPKSHWFVFIELDTYVNWDNMHRFLVRFDPATPYYFGSPVWPHKKPIFAHGGTGFVLSSAALDKLVAGGSKFVGRSKKDRSSYLPGTHLFGKDMQHECCGDEVLAGVLKESGVTLRGYWPMFNGEKPTTARFGREQWCEAILTLHHLDTEDFLELQRWEQTTTSSRRDRSKPLTFEELFFGLVEPLIRDRREDWTNMSEDVVYDEDDKNRAGKSYEACLKACTANERCIQFEHFGHTCRLSYDIRLGHRQLPNGGKRWTSGWLMERIHDFKASHSPCNGAHIVHANP
ncbi:hypothetical protein H2204_007378 [Knufia peltigerae]|uniref:N-acetylgalactosaminide beta-1,3-galactosyltransferase n=1 Tax=Knufia peltigerae TaxID=1002370 RepID=A0AA39CWZ4_9EURO|nr:hypothetical protein H2204_007378 [Knufia peltigerae]